MWHWTLTHFSFVCCVSQLLFLYFFIFHKLIWWVEEGLFTSYFSQKEISFIVSSICCPSPSFQLLPPGHFAVLINTPSSSLPSWCSIVCVCVCVPWAKRERLDRNDRFYSFGPSFRLLGVVVVQFFSPFRFLVFLFIYARESTAFAI